MTRALAYTAADWQKALDLWNEAIVSDDSDANIRAIAVALAHERRKAFNEGAVEGMKLTRTLTDERRAAFNEQHAAADG